MTATAAPPADVTSVVRRADTLYAKRFGDDPAPPEYVKAIADAVRPLLGQPGAAPAKVDGQAKALAEDNARLEEIVAELRRQIGVGDKAMDKLAREITNLKTQNGALETKLGEAVEDTKRRVDAAVNAIQTVVTTLRDEAEKYHQKLAAKDREINEARAERDTATAQLRDRPAAAPSGELEQLRTDNARLLRDLTAANRTLDEIADEEADAPAHIHHYPAPGPGQPLQPCACKQPYPRDPASFEVADEEVPDVEPWSAVIGQVRGELDGRWPA